MLLQTTNEILSKAAISTNKSIQLNEKPSEKNIKTSPEVLCTSKVQESAHKEWLKVSENPEATLEQKLAAKEHFKDARKYHRKAK